MSTLVMNIKREIWEFNRSLIWVPGTILVLIVASFLFNLSFNEHVSLARIAEEVQAASGLIETHHAQKLSLGLMTSISAMFLFIGAFVSLHYFISCLYDERKDKSIYFWRSLPVSDYNAVGTKLLMGSIVIPSIFMIFATALFLLALIGILILCIIMSVAYDTSIWAVWTQGSLISSYIGTWTLLIPIALWFLPFYTWLMLASAFANRAPFLWAVLPVVILLVGSELLQTYGVTDTNLVGNMFFEYFNFDESDFSINGESINPSNIKDMTIWTIVGAMFSKVSFIGLVISGIFLSAILWLRKHKNAV